MYFRKCTSTVKKCITCFYQISRHYASYQKEFNVNPFCSLDIKVPFNVSLIPLDVHKYTSCDKVILQLFSESPCDFSEVKCVADKNNVQLVSNSTNFPLDAKCIIEAPVKANINIKTVGGNIELSKFYGENVTAESDDGNISASGCHCRQIKLITAGNIHSANVLQAAELFLRTRKLGSIETEKLQGLSLHVETEAGNMRIGSSYCDNSTFISDTGYVNLRRCHKNCNVIIRKEGTLNTEGFDGMLNVDVAKGNATIQLSRIQENSSINVNGECKLKISRNCLEETQFEIHYKDIEIHEDVQGSMVNDEGGCCLYLYPESLQNKVVVKCLKGVVQELSLMEMFNIKTIEQL